MRFFIFQSKYKAFGSSSSHSKPRIISMWYQHREVRLWSWLCQRLESPHSPCPGCRRVMSPCCSLVQDVHSLSAMTCPSSAAGTCLIISVTQKASIVVYIYIYCPLVYIYIYNEQVSASANNDRADTSRRLHPRTPGARWMRRIHPCISTYIYPLSWGPTNDNTILFLFHQIPLLMPHFTILLTTQSPSILSQMPLGSADPKAISAISGHPKDLQPVLESYFSFRPCFYLDPWLKSWYLPGDDTVRSDHQQILILLCIRGNVDGIRVWEGPPHFRQRGRLCECSSHIV